MLPENGIPGTFPVFFNRQTSSGPHALSLCPASLEVELACHTLHPFDILRSSETVELTESTKLALAAAVVQTLSFFAELYVSKETSKPRFSSGHAPLSADYEPIEPEKSIYLEAPSSTGWCWIELFDPVQKLTDILFKKLSDHDSDNVAVCQTMTAVRDRLSSWHDMVVEARRKSHYTGVRAPLQWQKQKPVSIRMVTPKFHER
jgi:hypothetical protein